MALPEGDVHVHPYDRRVDMRRSFDVLYALPRPERGEDPMSASLYAFINRRATQIQGAVLRSHGLLCAGEACGARALRVGLEAVVDQGNALDEADALLEDIESRVIGRRYKYTAPVMQTV